MSSDRSGGAMLAGPFYRRVRPRTALVAIAGLALFDIGFYALAVRPVRNSERAAQERVRALERQLAQAQQGAVGVREAAQRVSEADVGGTTLVDQIALPRRTAYSTLLSELGEAAGESGVEIREARYSVESIEGSDEYAMLAVDANFRGRYESLVQLLYRLDRADLFFIVGSLGAGPRSDGPAGELLINMRFDLLVRDL